MKSPHQDKNKGMFRFFMTFLCKVCFLFLSLRYRIKIQGLDALEKIDKKKGLLFLPNHPAHMDPLFLFLFLWPTYRMRPLVVEYIYRLSFLKGLMKLVRGVFIPDFDTSVNEFKIKRGQEAFEKIAEGLKSGDHFILYPAGRLKNTGKEILGGASGAHALVQDCPEAQLVLIRTTGLWGSSFSRALLGRSPDLSKTLWKGVKTVFKNGIFFCPRREVQIEIELNPKELPRKGTRIEFNKYLEDWYNRYPDSNGQITESEPLKLVSYSFWRRDIPEVFEPKKKMAGEQSIVIQESTREKITAELHRILENANLEITDEKSLATDLGMDSLNIAELIAFVTKEYDVGELHPEDMQTVRDVLEIAEGARLATPSDYPKGIVSWPLEERRPSPRLPEGETLSEAFLDICDQMDGFAACGDDLAGVLSYKKIKRSALILSLYLRKKPEKNIGVLLPASVGAYVVILALQLAGKIPVMLNWTLGSRYLDEMLKTGGVKTVLTSWRFIEKLSHVEFGSLIDQIEFLEDIRKNLSFSNKLRGLFLSCRSAQSILRSLNLNQIGTDDPCVILFTSGTEAVPKGVPLSHKNILSNQRAAMQCMDLEAADVLYGVLPPFHSFGFSVAGLFSILAGLRIAFYPDPTDGFALAEGVERWHATLFCSPPGFLKGLFSSAKKDQLKTIRFFVTGAEKAPKELYERVENLKNGACLIEGYGLTECSPIVTMTRYNLPPKGVGFPLPDVEIRTIHLENSTPLPLGSEGEVCVYGPNVFKGYLGNPRDPFIEIEGKQWYRTGDIGSMDSEGNLILSGRLKRFIKIGGEMISLGAVEEILTKELLRLNKISADIPSLALCADERVLGKSRLVLFVIIPFQEAEANEILKVQGFSRLVKIHKVIQVEEIPLMGTGKTNYRQLQSLIN